MISLPSAPTRVSSSGLKVRSPAMAKAVTSSGEVTKACVAGLPSLRAAKFLLYDVTMEFASPASQHDATSALVCSHTCFCWRLRLSIHGRAPSRASPLDGPLDTSLDVPYCHLHAGKESSTHWPTFLDLCPLPLSNAGATSICKDCAADLGEGVQHAITLNGGSAGSPHQISAVRARDRTATPIRLI